jgi:hypothetical protein
VCGCMMRHSWWLNCGFHESGVTFGIPSPSSYAVGSLKSAQCGSGHACYRTLTQRPLSRVHSNPKVTPGAPTHALENK